MAGRVAGPSAGDALFVIPETGVKEDAVALNRACLGARPTP